MKRSHRAILLVPVGVVLILCVIMLLRPVKLRESSERTEHVRNHLSLGEHTAPPLPGDANSLNPPESLNKKQVSEGGLEQAGSLAQPTSPEFSQVLAKLRRTLSNGAVGPLALRILSELPDPADRLRAIETILRDHPSDTRSVGYQKLQALWMLGELGCPEGVPLALETLKVSDSPWLRKEAAVALGKLGDPSVSGALHAAYLGAPLEVKQAVVLALKRLGDSSLLPRFLDDASTALADPVAEVRQRTVGSLVNLDDPRKFPIAVRALKDKDNGVRAAATQVIRQMPSVEALPYWVSVLADREDYVRYTAQRRIEEILEAPGENLHQDAKVRAIRALGEFGDRQSLTCLRKLTSMLPPEQYLPMKVHIDQAIYSLDQRFKE